MFLDNPRYLKMEKEEFYKETLSVLKKYGFLNYSFAVRFTERRSKNLINDFGWKLIHDPKNTRPMVAGVVQALDKMAVMENNDGNIIFN